MSIVAGTSRSADIRRSLTRAREATLRLLDAIPVDMLSKRVHDFYSPVGWHFGHIAATEELWTLCNALGRQPRDSALSFLYSNIPENPKDNRVHLPERAEILGYMERTRAEVLDALDQVDLHSTEPLLNDGYAWEFALRHELQHQETICELLQLIRMQGYTRREGVASLLVHPPPIEPEMVSLPGGTFMMGSDDPHAYDNEKRSHEVTVAPFELDRTPVTVYQWKLFMEDGGYRRRELWTDEGWAWREREDAVCPEYWVAQRPAGAYVYCGPRGLRPLHRDEPVSSVSWFEADAYARWAGKRLPTEAEWEYTASYDPETASSRLYPWGDEEPSPDLACCGIWEWQPAPVADRPAGCSAFGLRGMAGGVWEWTSSPFLPYPGFVAWPYDGYSRDHMDGGHYVCKGGSWATSGPNLRCAFRNWYVPTYRQGFLGLRCAR
jgi:gamma-glutamyl hercynylcysteine S-oxide synthase